MSEEEKEWNKQKKKIQLLNQQSLNKQLNIPMLQNFQQKG